MSEMYKRFYDLYMKNMVTTETLKELAAVGKLTLDQIENMINERQNLYGY